MSKQWIPDSRGEFKEASDAEFIAYTRRYQNKENVKKSSGVKKIGAGVFAIGSGIFHGTKAGAKKVADKAKEANTKYNTVANRKRAVKAFKKAAGIKTRRKPSKNKKTTVTKKRRSRR